jgi:hypothetical protein
MFINNFNVHYITSGSKDLDAKRLREANPLRSYPGIMPAEIISGMVIINDPPAGIGLLSSYHLFGSDPFLLQNVSVNADYYALHRDFP